jgi:microcystin-dependent protein
MSEAFVAEIRIFGFNFAPRGWASCSGQLLPISQNTALFSLLGTYYGGDGRTNFGLPNLQGSVPMFYGQGPGLSLYDIGQSGGSQSVTLISSEMPAHAHSGVQANTRPAEANNPSAQNFGRSETNAYVSGAANTTLNAASTTTVGGNQPHNNLQPYLVMNFCIALQGVFPPRS